MWRTGAHFGHTETPTHHAAIIADTHASLADRVHDLGTHMGHTVWGERVMLCRGCHAELQVHEHAAGCCADTDACCWRALSERCCW